MGEPLPNYLKFVFGGTAAMAAVLFTQPLDLLKNRMQLSAQEKPRPNTLQVVQSILKNEGPLAFYNGISAGLLRQGTYATVRLGVFGLLLDAYAKNVHPPNFAEKASLGMVAGVAGAFVGTPAEVCLIRMTADGRLPPAERRNYKSVFDALARIVREEGVTMLWRGAIPTMGRAMVTNAAQLGTYSQTRESLLNSGHFTEGIFLHFCASMIAGIVTAVASMPVDMAKTRIQNMKSVAGKPEYSGTVDVMMKVVKNEGFFALWKGLTPYYFRIGPHTVLTFIFLEQLNAAYHRFVAKKQGDK